MILEEFVDWCSTHPIIEVGPLLFDPAALTNRPWTYDISGDPTKLQHNINLMKYHPADISLSLQAP